MSSIGALAGPLAGLSGDGDLFTRRSSMTRTGVLAFS